MSRMKNAIVLVIRTTDTRTHFCTYWIESGDNKGSWEEVHQILSIYTTGELSKQPDNVTFLSPAPQPPTHSPTFEFGTIPSDSGKTFNGLLEHTRSGCWSLAGGQQQCEIWVRTFRMRGECEAYQIPKCVFLSCSGLWAAAWLESQRLVFLNEAGRLSSCLPQHISSSLFHPLTQLERPLTPLGVEMPRCLLSAFLAAQFWTTSSLLCLHWCRSQAHKKGGCYHAAVCSPPKSQKLPVFVYRQRRLLDELSFPQLKFSNNLKYRAQRKSRKWFKDTQSWYSTLLFT